MSKSYNQKLKKKKNHAIKKMVSHSHASIRELEYQFMQLGKIRFELIQIL